MNNLTTNVLLQRILGILLVFFLIAGTLPMAIAADDVVYPSEGVALEDPYSPDYGDYEEEEMYDEDKEIYEEDYEDDEDYTEEYEYDEYLNPVPGYMAIVPFSGRPTPSAVVIDTGITPNGGPPWRLYDDGTLVIEGGFLEQPPPAGFVLTTSPWLGIGFFEHIVFEAPIVAGTRLTGLFRNLTDVVEIHGLDNIDTSAVTNMSSMFAGASSLVTIGGISDLDTSTLTSFGIQGMFSGASSLVSLDLSSWDVSNVASLSSVFEGTSSLVYLNVSTWDTSNVVGMGNVFDGASSLVNLDLSGWNTSNVGNMSGMFRNTHSLECVGDISNWNVSNLSSAGWMFFNASSLTSLDLSGWHPAPFSFFADTMFWGTSSLTSLNVSSWGLNTSTINSIFRNSGVVSLDLSTWDTRNTFTGWMFDGTGDLVLRELTLGENFMFHNTPSGGLPGLQSPPNNRYYTGFWINVGSGTVDTPEGPHVFTGPGLMEHHDSLPPGERLETWVWQRRPHPLPPPIDIVKTAEPNSVVIDDTITYTITVTYQGVGIDPWYGSFRILDVLPEHLELDEGSVTVSFSPVLGAGDGTISYVNHTTADEINIEIIADLEPVDITITITFDAVVLDSAEELRDLAGGPRIRNDVVVYCSDIETILGEDYAYVDVELPPPLLSLPSFEVIKTASHSTGVRIGDTIFYEILVFYPGETPEEFWTEPFRIVDVIPAHLQINIDSIAVTILPFEVVYYGVVDYVNHSTNDEVNIEIIPGAAGFLAFYQLDALLPFDMGQSKIIISFEALVLDSAEELRGLLGGSRIRNDAVVYHSDDETILGENHTYVGIELPPIITYTVTGQYPATFNPSIPGVTTHEQGTTVTVASIPTTTETTNGYGVAGTWTFIGWTTMSVGVTVADGTFAMPGNDVLFTGYWVFTPDEPYNGTPGNGNGNGTATQGGIPGGITGGSGTGQTPGDVTVPSYNGEYSPFSPYHNSFIIGRPSGNIYPRDNMTRAEVATIFFRLLSDDFRIQRWSQDNQFSDVGGIDWFNNAVSTMANAGVVQGRPDGSFQPNQPITRAEMAAITARFFEEIGQVPAAFTDISGHWAEGYINRLAQFGWVQGDGDGTFRPNDHITRAEVAAIVNRMLNRVPYSADSLLDGRIRWPDKANLNAWYYLYLQEASHSTEFERLGSGYLNWTALLSHIEWQLLERPYSRPYDITLSRR